MAIRRISEICSKMLFSKLRLNIRAMTNKRKAPNNAKGVPSRILNGRDQLSYCAANMRNTKKKENAKMSPADPEEAFS
jgi:hypothetical protein